MTGMNEVLDRALELPQPRRATIAHRLIQSLDEGADTDWETAWEAEIESRLAKVSAGTYRAQDFREALAEIRNELNAVRP